MPTSVRAAWMSFTRALAARRRTAATTSSTSSAQISFERARLRRRRPSGARVGVAAAGARALRRRDGRRAPLSDFLASIPAGMKRSFTPPNRTSGAPSSRRSPVTREPPTYVPLVEFMSTTYQPSSRRWSFAWISLTLSSVRRTSLLRPSADVGKGRANRIAHPLRGTLVQHLERRERSVADRRRRAG